MNTDNKTWKYLNSELFFYDFVIITVLVIIAIILSCILINCFSGPLAPNGNKFISEITPTPIKTVRPAPSPTPIPSLLQVKKVIDVVFTSQAPFAAWDYFHEETCEEAALVMVYAWQENINLTPTVVDEELKKITDWEIANFGNFDNESSAQVAQMAKKIYGINSTIIRNPTIEQIKNEIDNDHILLMGMAGRLLDNPNFKSPGPLYHMLLVKGYDEPGFITNDPGTRKGKGFRYTYQNFMESARDWDTSLNALSVSTWAAIVFSK